MNAQHPQNIPGSIIFVVHDDGRITIPHADPVIRVTRKWLEQTLLIDGKPSTTPIYGTPECDTDKPHITQVSIVADNVTLLYRVTEYDQSYNTFTLRWPD
jgi:hypothetical protein